MTYNFNLMD